MPTRVLRDWTDSERVNALSFHAEVLFVRLIMKADDYGRYTANPRLIKNLCFPLKDGLRDADISRFLAECEKAGLIAVYQAEEKPFLEIINFKQRTRASASKFPSPEQLCLAFDGQVSVNGQTDVGHPRAETETETETNIYVNNPGNQLPVADGGPSATPHSPSEEKTDSCPHEQIIAAWHATMPELPKVRVWGQTSRANLRSRWREDLKRQSVEWWKKLFEYCRQSEFLMGKTEKPFGLTLGWIVGAKNFEKIANGTYHRTWKQPQTKPSLQGSTFEQC